MCGIATISIGRRARGRISYPKLQLLVQELLKELEIRGADASGIAVINEGGSLNSCVYKKPLRASRLVVRPKFRETLNRIGPNTNFILLHARATTVGSNTNQDDNHPIIADRVVGVHNGTLQNDSDLEVEFNLERTGKVDSEIIFRLFQHFLDEGQGPQEAIKRTSKELKGAYTGAAVDLRYPYRMTMFKHERPLSVIHLPYYDILVAVSEIHLYDQASSAVKLVVKDKLIDVPEDRGFVVDLSDNGGSTADVQHFPLPTKGYQWGGAYSLIGRHGLRSSWS